MSLNWTSLGVTWCPLGLSKLKPLLKLDFKGCLESLWREDVLDFLVTGFSLNLTLVPCDYPGMDTNAMNFIEKFPSHSQKCPKRPNSDVLLYVISPIIAYLHSVIDKRINYQWFMSKKSCRKDVSVAILVVDCSLGPSYGWILSVTWGSSFLTLWPGWPLSVAWRPPLGLSLGPWRSLWLVTKIEWKYLRLDRSS